MSEILSSKTIKLLAVVESKKDAIKQAGDLLVLGDCVTPEYIEGMHAREETMSTYIGNGVAIPHGKLDNLSQVLKTGISVLQVPAGIEWEPGEIAYLVVGIAATSDEHINILMNLAEAIEDEEVVAKLTSTDQKEIIMEYLNKPINEED